MRSASVFLTAQTWQVLQFDRALMDPMWSGSFVGSPRRTVVNSCSGLQTRHFCLNPGQELSYSNVIISLVVSEIKLT